MTAPTPPPPDPFASVVTARDVYDATRETQSDVRRALDRLDAHDRELAELAREQERHRTEVAQEQEKQRIAVESEQALIRARLDAIDRWRYALPITSISAVAAAVAAILTAVLGT